jgi:putative ATP-dependent endonuclease of OLD family
MFISNAEIENYRALQKVTIPLSRFSVLIGENDVGKTSLLYALDAFFENKKVSDPDDFFKKDTSARIRITLTFVNLPTGAGFDAIRREEGSVVIQRDFLFDKPPTTKVVAADGKLSDLDKKLLKEWFSSDSFHFIPVRRDLSVQFSMNKTALLGKTLRAKMKSVIDSGDASASLRELQEILKGSLKMPQEDLENFLQEQLHNKAIRLSFDDLQIDPVEGVSFSVRLSDDRVDNILIKNRGAGTQNNLVIALFRLIAKMNVGEYLIFAMEEPENSLHPKAQRQLLSVLQEISEESQVIVTTHSPVFLERTKFENNILLTRTAKGNTVAKTFKLDMLSQLRTDLGIRPSDALLKGGGNCALLVEGNTEEDGFPTMMEMCGISEFQLGISIINMRGCDSEKVRNTARLLLAYDIPCVVVLDKDATQTETDLNRERTTSLRNIRRIIRLSKGNIEDYYPIEIVAEVINQELKPNAPVSVTDFDGSKAGPDRLKEFKRVMYEHGAGDSIGILKRSIGLSGTKMLRDRGVTLDPEIREIFEEVRRVVQEQ